MTPEEEVRRLLDIARQRREFLSDNAAALATAEEESQIEESAVEGAITGGVTAAVAPPIIRRMLPSGTPRNRIARGLVNVGRGIVDTARRRPLAFGAAEVAGGAGAGAAMQAMDEAGHGTPAQIASGVGAGLITGNLPVALTNLVGRGVRWGMRNLAPVFGGLPGIRKLPIVRGIHQESVHNQAANRLQGLAGDPAAAAQAAANASPGMTPARATGDPNLLSLEARALLDDPQWASQVAQDLVQAAQKAKTTLASMFGSPRGRADWEQAVFERVSAPGTTITAGTTDEMLDAAEESFTPLYEQAKGWPIFLRLMNTGRRTDLRTLLTNAAESNTVAAGPQERQTATRFIQNAFSSLVRRSQRTPRGPQVDSGRLLQFRSDLRTEARRLMRSNPEAARLIRLASDRVTSVLASQLSPDLMRLVRGADRQYRLFSTVADSIARDTNNALSPNGILRSLGAAAGSRGARARVAQTPLGQLAQSGRSATEFLNHPEVAARAVQGANTQTRQALQSDFVNTLLTRSIKALDGGTRLANLIRMNERVATSLGMTPDEIARLRNTASELQNIQRASPAAQAQLLNEGPATTLQAIFTVLGVLAAPDVRGPGQLAISGFFAKRARALLEFLNKDSAQALLVAAHKDPTLYSALLTRNTAPIAQQAQAARVLNAWAVSMGAEMMDDDSNDQMQELREEAEGLGIDLDAYLEKQREAPDEQQRDIELALAEQ